VSLLVLAAVTEERTSRAGLRPAAANRRGSWSFPVGATRRVSVDTQRLLAVSRTIEGDPTQVEQTPEER
jgi:hypothetical protein